MSSNSSFIFDLRDRKLVEALFFISLLNSRLSKEDSRSLNSFRILSKFWDLMILLSILSLIPQYFLFTINMVVSSIKSLVSKYRFDRYSIESLVGLLVLERYLFSSVSFFTRVWMDLSSLVFFLSFLPLSYISFRIFFFVFHIRSFLFYCCFLFFSRRYYNYSRHFFNVIYDI